MSETRRTFSRSSVPFGLLGMLALIALVESVVAHNLDGFSTDHAIDWQERGKTFARKAGKNEILCLGDSMVKFGIVPKILEDRLGKRTYNGAIMGGQPTSNYFLLKRALDSGAKPSALLIDFHGFLLGESPSFNIRVWPGLANTLELLDLVQTSKDLDFFAKVMVSRPLLSLRARHEIRKAIVQSLNGVAPTDSELARKWISYSRRNWAQNKGAHIMAKKPGYHGEIEGYPQPLFQENWKCDPVNQRYLRRFLDLAASHEIPVFWLIPPVVSRAQVGREQIGFDRAYDRLIRKAQAKYSNLVVIDGRHGGFDDTHFIDPIHLDRDGATVLSVAVADAMRPYLQGQEGPRWVALPHAGGINPTLYAVEDVIQSSFAITAKDATKVVR